MVSVFLIVGISLLGGLLAYLAFEDWRFYSKPRLRTQGSVSDHRRSLDDGSESFQAVVRFVTRDGRTVEILDQVGYPTRRPDIGATVDVVYPIGRPEAARVHRLWLRPVIYVSTTVALLVLVFHWQGVLK